MLTFGNYYPAVGETPVYEVAISGFNLKEMSEEMLEVMIEQVGLEERLVTLRKVGNEMHVTFDSSNARERCLRHFAGRPWGVDGKKLQVRRSPEDGTGITLPPGLGAEKEDARNLHKWLSTDDDSLLLQMETREDLERGNDKRNLDTFGPEAWLTKWSFEEQVAANKQIEQQFSKWQRPAFVPMPRFGKNKMFPVSLPVEEAASTIGSESELDERIR